MKHKYWAKKKYSQVDPVDYALQRFTTPAGKLIDEVEKKSVLDLLLNSGIEPKKKLRILDVATGPGRLGFYLEKHLKKAEITGMDINENMLRRAKKIAYDSKSKVKFMRGDVYDLPFRDGEFDIITGLRFSMHLPQFQKALGELSRVLKKDGVLVFDVFNYQSILQLKLLVSHNKKRDCGFYTIDEITNLATGNNLKLMGYKGILLLGETLLRKTSPGFLAFFSVIVNSPPLLRRFSSKLVLGFKKYE